MEQQQLPPLQELMQGQDGRWIYMMEAFNRLQEDIRLMRSLTGQRLSMDEVLGVIVKSELYKMFPVEQIMDTMEDVLDDENENELAQQEEHQQQQSTEPQQKEYIGQAATYEYTIMEYMKESMQDDTGMAGPNDFEKFIEQKLDNPNLGQEEANNLRAINNELKTNKNAFEQTKQEAYYDWLVGNLMEDGGVKDNPEKGIAHRHLSYCPDGDVVCNEIPGKEGEPGVRQFGIRVPEDAIAQKYGKGDIDGMVVFQTLPMEQAHNIETEDMQEVDNQSEKSGWKKVSSVKALQNVLHNVDVNKEKSEMGQEREQTQD